MGKTDKEQLDNYWSSFTEQASEITTKRLTLNSIYLTMEAGLIGFSVAYLKLVGLFLSVSGLMLCVIWFLTILSFRRLNAAKFDIIVKLEEEIGANINPYLLEWEIAKKRKYIKLTTLELITTFLIALIFVAILVLSIISLING